MLKSDVFDRNVPRGGCLSFQTITDSFRSQWHSHPEYEIAYIKNGKGVIQYGSTIFEYQEGSLLLLGPWVPHEFRENSSNHQSISFLFTESFLSIDLFECDTAQHIKQLLKNSIFGLYFTQPIDDHLNCSIQEINQKKGMEQAIDLYFLLKKLSQSEHQKLQELLPKGQESTKFYKKYTQLQKILAHINIHLSEKITLQDVAEDFYVSKSYLSQLFNEFIQTTFTDYLSHQRLYYACRLLATSNQPITEISEKVGFTSLSSFNRQFLKTKNMSPREFRKQQMADFIAEPL